MVELGTSAAHEIISKLWVCIKANNLQDATNKRNINADAKLKGSCSANPQVSCLNWLA